MKLNHDCVRDVLLFVEENLPYGHYVDFSAIEIPDYSREDLLYTADKLIEADYLNGKKENYLGSHTPAIRVTSMTWSGHQFLDNIRDDSVWKSTKKVLSKFSSVSLSLMGNVASQVITSLVQNQIG